MNYSRTEADEQKAVIQWCILMEGRWPELEYIYHVPNGGSRNAREAANLKAQGVKPGVPDLELPDPLRMDLENFLNRQLIKYKEEFQRM